MPIGYTHYNMYEPLSFRTERLYWKLIVNQVPTQSLPLFQFNGEEMFVNYLT